MTTKNYIGTKQDITNEFFAFDENIVIETKAARAGEEISIGGFVVGTREHGEIPLVGTIVAIGGSVPTTENSPIALGNVVLLPNGRLDHVPDPRYLTGEIASDEQRQLVTTHYKNIRVVYKKA